jgi:hypothetical protein
MSLITGKKVKTHISQGIVKNKCTKPTKEWLDVAIWLQVIFSEYSKVFRIGTKSVTQNRCKKFPQAT